jgi:RNA polymerase sigma-70 factor (ECF subfamily)
VPAFAVKFRGHRPAPAPDENKETTVDTVNRLHVNGDGSSPVRTAPMNAGVSDEELMRRLASGQREALGPLYSRYNSLVSRLAAKWVGEAGAEEIVQEVFLAVWQNAATFDPSRGSFRAWMIQIARTRSLNELRRRARRPRSKSSSSGSEVDSLADSVIDPVEAVSREQRRAAVRAAVEALPPRERAALSLAFLEELTNEQVATFLGLPVGTAKSRIRSGLKTLRARLAPLFTVGLLLAGAFTVLGIREQAHRAALQRHDRALRLVTNSEVVPLRLSAAPGTDPAAHGNYRGRPGIDMAVLTLSHLGQAPRGYEYRAWASHGGRWTLLGRPWLDSEGRSLLIAEGPDLVTPPDELLVTLDPIGNRAERGSAPTSAPVVRWPAQ